MKKFLFASLILINLGCKNKSNEFLSHPDSFRFSESDSLKINNDFFNSIKFSMVALDSINPDIISTYRDDSSFKFSTYPFFKLQKDQAEKIFNEKIISVDGYGVYFVANQYESKNIKAIIDLNWDDFVLYNNLLTIDTNGKLIDQYIVSGIFQGGTGTYDDDKVSIDYLKIKTSTKFYNNGTFISTKVNIERHRPKNKKQNFIKTDSTIYEIKIDTTGKFIIKEILKKIKYQNEEEQEKNNEIKIVIPESGPDTVITRHNNKQSSISFVGTI